MFRILNVVSVLALLAAAGAVYQVKYSSAFEAQKIAKLRDDIRAERDRIAILNAEWARRTSPERIQSLAEHHLDMQPLDVDHLDTLDKLPAKAEANGDALGGMIEALVDGPIVTSALPKGGDRPAEKPAEKPVAARPASTGAVRAPLPLSAVPPAGVMAPGGIGRMPAPAAGPLMTAPVTSAVPLLPPGSVGE
ncbi:cell division protein FtsL [Ancylobacter lacus]|uniref:cell division protein FtsL n=1 Tax=Ancylobacter lacus TaxID=2579970 RepID=UPI001BCD4C67|nr:hypothetical protein [Ancylobacter lacus]MBS7538562.1 hypothetical protein [Ancylobacter lacus]